MLCSSHIRIWNLANHMKKQNKKHQNARSIGEKPLTFSKVLAFIFFFIWFARIQMLRCTRRLLYWVYFKNPEKIRHLILDFHFYRFHGWVRPSAMAMQIAIEKFLSWVDLRLLKIMKILVILMIFLPYMKVIDRSTYFVQIWYKAKSIKNLFKHHEILIFKVIFSVLQNRRNSVCFSFEE